MGIEIKGDTKFLERYRRLVERELRTGVGTSVLAIQGAIISLMTRKRLIDTGHLRDSISASVSIEQGKVLGTVGTNVLYALPIELGITKKFFPSRDMIESIQKWAKRKLGLSEKESKLRGFLIAKKIGREGMDPRRFPSHFFSEGTEQATSMVEKIMGQHFKRAEGLAAKAAGNTGK